MTPEQELLLMQVCDSVFPIGAYAHSYGLETYVQLRIVRDEATAREFLGRQVAFPLCRTELLGMRLAYEAASAGRLDEVRALEDELIALKVPAETRAASAKLAARFCKTAAALLGAGGTGGGEGLFSTYAADRPAEHCVNAAYGVFAACAGIDLPALMARYLYAQASALVTTCVKLVPLSQTAGQRVLFSSRGAQVAAVRCALELPRESLGLSMPGFDTRCIEHESLYSRLYMS